MALNPCRVHGTEGRAGADRLVQCMEAVVVTRRFPRYYSDKVAALYMATNFESSFFHAHSSVGGQGIIESIRSSGIRLPWPQNKQRTPEAAPVWMTKDKPNRGKKKTKTKTWTYIYTLPWLVWLAQLHQAGISTKLNHQSSGIKSIPSVIWSWHHDIIQTSPTHNSNDKTVRTRLHLSLSRNLEYTQVWNITPI